ncbi:uncharacterized protein RHOBADRAFT_53229 [Rhodotorula graminis WP1]|uniref:Symplekin C-terminal domain-containing protein n=1 Tax=Rhodotorula graminis (strain WP1) TaxID=578459 RepID=A0A194S727_RHOGW|nr:uncharacterized protein RHOBADRAFT_53229 [Rhodotorula graminis WP1]KPV75221.1 hypothetical protein RHOBADRAFT_53229 [Rhodotorula graminis WP1]
MSYYPPQPPSQAPAAPSSSSDLDLVSALSQPSTQPALKANVQAVEPLSRLLLSSSTDLAATKLALAGFATAYPFLFRYASQSGDHAWWTRVVNLKTAVLQQWRSGSPGAKVAAVKVLQRIIQTQSNAGTADPRLARNPEPNLSLVRANHPFLKIAALEDEANKLLGECITTLFTSASPDLVGAVVASLATLVKSRPQYVKLVVTSLTNWTPAALAGQGAAQVKSVEKVVRISLSHLVKTSHATSFSTQIADFLALQSQRMDAAALEARRARDDEASRKRALLASQIDDVGGGDSKRRRLNPAASTASEGTTAAFRAANLNPGTATPSIAELPLDMVVDLLVATLQNVSAPVLGTAIDTVRRNLPASSSADTHDRPASLPPSAPAPDVTPAPVIDPLKLDLGADELDLRAEVPPEPARAASEEADDAAAAADQAAAFAATGLATRPGAGAADMDLAAPLEMTLDARHAVVLSALKRVCAAGPDGASDKVWVPLVSRLITRGLEVEADEGERRRAGEGGEVERERARRKGDEMREVVFRFVAGDLQGRTELARLWLNEEWYACKRRGIVENRPYDHWLRKFLEHVGVASSNKDRELLQFLMDLPEIPVDEIYRLEGMAVNADQMQLGFSTLRELVVLRPSVRPAALDVLLGLTTHADKRVRNAAIMTVKKWVPDMRELTPVVHAFALELVERLKVAPPAPKEDEGAVKEGEEGEGVKDKDGEEDMKVDDEASPAPDEPKEPFALVRGGKVVDRLEPPTTLGGVTQHVELLLALCVKEPALLFPLFERYGAMQPFAQDALEELIAPLIRSLGLKHEGLLDLVGRFPAGSDKLMFRVLEIAADKTKLPSNVTGLIRQVAAERELDQRFYPIILPECSKAEVVRWLPHVIKLLDGTPLKKAQTRSIFLSIIAPPAHFSSINSLRTRSDSITPVELMMYLHKHDKEMGLKNTIEAISICFSMADGFRPEILAAFMQQAVDEPVIPNLFLRTVIQAVTTYKSLQPFVSTTLLSRLIAKKVWTVGPLWEGFVRLAKAIAPNSFAALLQLPKEQLAEVVVKQPSLRAPLREYVVKKGGANHARSQAVLEAIGEDDPAGASGGATPKSGSATPMPPPLQA